MLQSLHLRGKEIRALVSGSGCLYQCQMRDSWTEAQFIVSHKLRRPLDRFRSCSHVVSL